MSPTEICHRCLHVDWIIQGHPPCTKNGKYFVENAEAGDCPMDYFEHPEMVQVTVPKVDHGSWGSALWAEMHAHPHPDAAYIATVTARLPCGDCKAHWMAYVAANPPDGTSGWVDRAHAAVDKRLNKPEFKRQISIASA